MKRFKIGFLAVTALVAICLTAATRPEVIKKFKPAFSYSCVSGTDFTAFDVVTAGDTHFTTSEASCATSYCYSSVNSSTTAGSGITCPDAGSIFCCAEVKPNVQACKNISPFFPNQLIIHCKLTN
jgi:hypothetical protein